MAERYLDDDEFRELLKNAPLVAFDLIVKDEKGRILLGYRKNSPAKNKWFVPGGRIRKDESFEKAFKRITLDELGQELDLGRAKLARVTEHFYDDNRYDMPGLSTHYVVIVYLIEDFIPVHSGENDQHSLFRWFETGELLSSGDVHQNTKAYFTE